MTKTKSHRAPKSGSISKNPSGTYRAQVSIPSSGGNKARRETKSFKTKREAEGWIRLQISDVESGLSAENFNMTVKDYYDQWLATKKLIVRLRTLDDYQRLCCSYILPHFGNHIMRNIKTGDVNAFYVGLEERKIGRPTIRYIHRVLRNLFSDAIKIGVINLNPCTYSTPPKATKSRNVEAMSESELVEFLKLGDKTPYSAMFRTAATTGMRLGELLGLTWRDVNFAKSIIHVNKQIPTRHLAGTAREPISTKTEAGNRVLPVGQTLLRVLQDHYEEQRRHIVLMGSRWHSNNLVFPSGIGTPLQPGYPEKSSKKIFSALGLGTSFTFHNLRHTAASIMLHNGMSLVEVSKYLGHASPSITANIYAHIIPGGMEKAIHVFDKVILGREEKADVLDITNTLDEPNAHLELH